MPVRQTNDLVFRAGFRVADRLKARRPSGRSRRVYACDKRARHRIAGDLLQSGCMAYMRESNGCKATLFWVNFMPEYSFLLCYVMVGYGMCRLYNNVRTICTIQYGRTYMHPDCNRSPQNTRVIGCN